eukprot:2322001-Pyramimonas_sp.AAC.1
MPRSSRVIHARGGLDETRTRGPFWDPAGNAPFRGFVREVHARLNVARGSMTPPRQAAALQRGLGGLARALAIRQPSTIINYGVALQGGRTDGV